jgi:ankyrin repeat protein/Tfp pilus assembly protein PilF
MELRNAIIQNDEEAVAAALKAGASLDETEGFGGLPLNLAVVCGNAAIVRMLLAHGADASGQDYLQRTPLHMAARHGNEEMIADLLAHGADPGIHDHRGYFPLHDAVQYKQYGAIRALLEAGVDPNRHTTIFHSALHLSAVLGDLEAAKLLLDAGADPNQASLMGGWTPLHEAAGEGCLDVAALLIAYDADIHAKDFTGATPLHEACEHGYLSIVRLLLAYGADQDVPDASGRTPREVAMRKKRKTIIESIDEARRDLPAVSERRAIYPFILQAQDHLAQQSPDQALARYDQGLALHPYNPELSMNKSLVLIDMEKYDDCEAWIEKYIGARPDGNDSLFMKVGLLSSMQKFREALECIETLDRNDIKSEWLEPFRCRALAYLGRKPEAIEHLLRIVGTKPEKTDLVLLLAQLFLAQNNMDAALMALMRGASRNPDSHLITNVIGRLLAAKNQHGPTLEFIWLSICSNPDFPDSWLVAGSTLHQLNQDESALACCKRFLVLDQSNAVGWCLLANIYMRAENYSEALIAIENGLTLERNDADIWRQHSAILKKLGRDPESQISEEKALDLERLANNPDIVSESAAKIVFQTLLDKMPKEISPEKQQEVFSSFCSKIIEQENFGMAQAVASLAIQWFLDRACVQEAAWMRCARALGAKNSNELDAAMSELDEVLSIAHEFGMQKLVATVHDYKGLLLRRKQRFPAAIEEHARAIKIFTDLGFYADAIQALSNQTLVLIETGDLELAEKNMLQVIEFGENEFAKIAGNGATMPDSMSNAWDNLGAVYMKMEQYEKAIECHRRALVVCLKNGDAHGMIMVIWNIVQGHICMNNYPEAIEMLQHGIEINERCDMSIKLVELLEKLGVLQFKMRDFEAGRKSLRKAAGICASNGGAERAVQIEEFIAEHTPEA